MSIRNMMIGGAGASVPDAPTSVSASATGVSSLSVSFSAPANNGGSPITGYTVFVNGGSPVTGASSPISITGLTASTSYTITMYATNAVGNSVLTAGVTGTTNASYIGTVVFTSSREWTTSQSDYTIPAGTTHIRVKVWGSGGSNAGYDNGLDDGNGGGGGFSDAIIAVTSGETIKVAVGSPGNNGSGSSTFASPGGGFSGILRGSTALVLSGGGGTGQTNASAQGGAGGGSSGQTTSNGSATAGTQSSGWFFYTGSNPGGEGGGGGYWSGTGTWTSGSAGGSGFIGGPGVSQATTTTGNYRTPAGTGDSEYPGAPRAYGGIGFNGSPAGNGQGYGYVIMHCYAINPSGLPAPSPRNTLATL